MFRFTAAFFSFLQLILILGLAADSENLYAAVVSVEQSSKSSLGFTAYFDSAPIPANAKLSGEQLRRLSTRTAFGDSLDKSNAVQDYNAICIAVPAGAEATLTNVNLNLGSGGVAGADNVYLTKPTEYRGIRIARLMVPAKVTLAGSSQAVESATAQINFAGAGNGTGSLSHGPLDDLIRNLLVNGDQIDNWYPVTLRKSSAMTDNPFPNSTDWLRIAITQTGVYRITGADLDRAGVNLAAVDPSQLRLFYEGGKPLPIENDAPHDSLQEMAILVQDGGDGNFGPGDAIVFYAQGADFWDRTQQQPEFVYDSYSDRNVYYLALSGNFSSTPLRIASESGSGIQVTDTLTQFADYVHREENSVLAENSDGDVFDYYHWYWGLAGDNQLFFSLPAPAPQSVNSFAVSSTRSNFNIRVNGIEADYDSTGQPGLYYFHSDRFTPGVNQVDVDYVLGDGYIDWIEIRLHRQLQMPDGEELTVTYPGDGVDRVAEIDLNGVASPMLFDISNPYVQKLMLPDISSGKLFFASVGGSSPQSYVIADANSLRTPFSIVRTEFDNIVSTENGADLIVITHDNLANAAMDYADYRAQTDGLRVRVVKVSDIYAHFSGGRLDPVAIRDFLRYAYQNWQGDAPSFCLLAGDGVYDFRNNLGLNGVNYVPPFIVEGDESVSDENYVYFGDLYNLDSDNSYPTDRGVDMVISRWPVKSATEFETVLSKTRSYEQTPDRGSWRNLITLIADDANHPGFNIPETFHTEDSETLATNIVPPDFEIQKIYGISYPFGAAGEKPEMRADVIRAINDGSLIVNYIGHGNPNVWADERIFRRTQDIPLLNNIGKLPLIFNASCSIGFFDNPASEGMAEDLLRYPNGGAVGTISATRLVFSRPNFEFNKAGMTQLLGDNGYTIAEAVYVTKLLRQGTFGVGDNDRKYIYIGDPLTRLAIPPDEITFSTFDPDSLVALAVTELAGSIESPTGELRSDFNGELTVSVFDNQRDRSVQVSSNTTANYWEYGPEIYRGKVDVTNGEYNLKFVVPKDITYGGQKARISAYATGTNDEAAGVIFPVAIGSINKSVSDTTGPDMTVYFADTPGLSDGASVAQNTRVTIELFDSLGINLSGEIGHGIDVSFDDNPDFNIEVTDSFSYFPQSYQRGRAEFDLPQLAIGEHTMKVKAWDSANNSNQVALSFNLTADEGLAITELLCYPNPMRDHTEFSYVLSGAAENVTLKLFTLSGLEIWSRSNLPGDRGYNVGVDWDGHDADGDIIANGVYIFQLSANAEAANSSAGNGKASATGKLVLMK